MCIEVIVSNISVVCFETLCSTGTRVRQGHSLSPLLFIIYGEAMVREVCQRQLQMIEEAYQMFDTATDVAVLPGGTVY